MEFDPNLLFNFMSIFLTVLLLIATTTTVFQKLKWRWPTNLNCWFCNKNTKVWKQQLNWWRCSHCEQYNGFTKDGDYACKIPEQYKMNSNSSRRYCESPSTEQHSELTKNNLCQKCNQYERMKLSKLSEFIPTNEKNFEYEVQQLKQRLEEKYPLCGNCKRTVHRVLQKQSVWLAQYKMLLFKQKPIQAILKNAKYSESVFRIISTILDSMIIYNTELLLLPVGGLFFQLCACWVTPAKRRSSDILLAFLWICITILTPFKNLKLLKADLNNVWFSLNCITQYHVIILFAFIIGIVNIMPKSQKNTTGHNMSFKKLTSTCLKDADDDIFEESASNYHDYNTKLCLDSTKTTLGNQFSNPLNCTSFTERPTIPTSTLSLSPPTNLEPQPCFSSFTADNFCKSNNIPDNHLFSSTLTRLNNLSLGEGLSKYEARTPKIFERKMHNPKSSSLFKKSNNSPHRKLILSPPKLKSVIQTSWVAGGYWQEGIDAPSLSRSSSQSSGFGSTGSNFAPSREPSVHEFDQCSVISDITQSCYIANRPSPISTSTSHQYSPYSFAEPKNSMFGQTVRFPQSQPITPPASLLMAHQRGSPVCMDQCIQSNPQMNVSEMKNSSEVHMFPGHTTTIVTSPVWLPALLCGSLVLNIIVLCTTLLR